MAKPKTESEKKPAASKKAPAAKTDTPKPVKAPKAKKEPKEPALPPLFQRDAVAEQIDPRSIRLDGKTQFRVTHSKDTVDDYADRMEAGDKFPPVKLVLDHKGNRWPHDGHQRIMAAIKAGRVLIDAETIKGTQRDAQFLALSANITNGLHRTRADIRNAAVAILGDSEWSGMSNREIARHIGVSDPFIGKVRGELKADTDAQGKKDAGSGQMALPGTDDAQKQEAWQQEQDASRQGADGKSRRPPQTGEDTQPEGQPEGQPAGQEAAESTEGAGTGEEAPQAQEGGDAAPGDGQGEDAGTAEGDAEQPGEGEEHPAGGESPAAGTTLAPQPPAKKPADNRTDDQKRSDAARWIKSTDHIQAVLGMEMVEALQDGRVDLSEQDVIRYGELTDTELDGARQSMLNNWPFFKHQRAVQGIVNGDSKLSELVNKAISLGGAYSLAINGYTIAVNKEQQEQQEQQPE